MQAGYYSMQCMCGFWSSAHLKPQSQWTDDEAKRESEHQRFHLMQQALLDNPSQITPNQAGS